MQWFFNDRQQAWNLCKHSEGPFCEILGYQGCDYEDQISDVVQVSPTSTYICPSTPNVEAVCPSKTSVNL